MSNENIITLTFSLDNEKSNLPGPSLVKSPQERIKHLRLMGESFTFDQSKSIHV